MDTNEKIKTNRNKFYFGDKVTWHEDTGKVFRCIFDFMNKNGDAIILMHPVDFDRKEISWGHHDVLFEELTIGWDMGLVPDV